MKQIKSVIVKNSVVTFSGTLLQENFILVTSHLINSVKNNDNERFWVIDKEEEHFTTREAFLIGNLCTENVKSTLGECFGDIYDHTESVKDIVELFTIHVLSFDCEGNVEALIHQWRSQMPTAVNLNIGDDICIRAAPFGSRHLLNSYSQGIVSNFQRGIVLTDCPTVFGCEGGAVIAKKQNVPVGVVVSSMAGWRGEWTGLTLAITFDAIFCKEPQMLQLHHQCNTMADRVNRVKHSLVYVKSGSSWGTGICIDKQKRLILTNAHVINDAPERVTLLSGSVTQSTAGVVATKARIVYLAQRGQQFDLALLRADDLTSFEALHNVTFGRRALKVGDPVFTLGFPLFNHKTQMAATMTRGHVALIKAAVVMTTCAVLPGASGGALCDEEGQLVGVVTCNITDLADGRSHAYPHVNLSIPANRIEPVLRKFIQCDDVRVLHGFVLEEEFKSDWAISKL